MFDPEKLRACIRDGLPQDDRSVARQLTRVARDIRVLDDERRRLMNRYANGRNQGRGVHNREPRSR